MNILEFVLIQREEALKMLLKFHICVFLSVFGLCASKSVYPQQQYQGILVAEDGNSFHYELRRNGNGNLEIWVDVANKFATHLRIQDPTSAAVLESLNGNNLCLIAQKTKTKGSRGECFKIGLRDLSVVSNILTQCDGRIILPLENTRCTPEYNLGKRGKSVHRYPYVYNNIIKRRKRDLFGFLRQKVGEALKTAEEALKNVHKSEVVKAIQSTGKAIKNTADDVISSVKTSDVGQALSSTGQIIKSAVEDAVQTLQNSQVGQKIDGLGDAIKRTAEEVASSVKNSSLLQDARESIRNITNEIRSSSIGDTLKSAGESIKRGTQEAFDSVKSTGQDVIRLAKNSDIGKGVSDAAKTLKTKAEEAVDTVKQSSLGQEVANFGKTIGDHLKEASKSIEPTVKKAGERIEKVVSSVTDTKEKPSPTLEQV